MVEPKTSEVRRIEVISGTGRRRTFSIEQKAKILEETLAPAAVVSEVARRHGLSAQQLFTWRRAARRRAEAEKLAPAFARAIVEEPGTQATPAAVAAMEIEIGAAHVWLRNGIDADLAVAVIRALKDLA